MSENSRAETLAAHPAGGLLTESGTKFLATYRIWIIAAIWLAVRGYVFWGLSPNFYVENFLKIAGDWLDGFRPYAAFQVEYPPGALLLFTLPRLFTDSPAMYGYLFAVVMLLADLGILFLLWRIPVLFDNDASEIRSDTDRRSQSALLCLTYVLFTAIFGRLLYQGYELVIGLLLTASIYLALRKKHLPVDLLLALGIWFNLAVIVGIPLVWWYGFISRDQSNLPGRTFNISELLRYLFLRAAVFCGGLLVLYLPFLIYSGGPLLQIVRFHFERGTQLESTAASLLIVGAKLFGFELATDFVNRGIHLSGEIGSRGAAACGIVSIIVFVILTAIIAQRMWAQKTASARNWWLIRGLLALILALLTTSKIFLPQYLLWVSPLAAVLANETRPRLNRIGWQLFAVILLSSVIFFFFYPNLIEMQVLPGLLLLIRNLFVVYLVLMLLLRDPSMGDRRLPKLSIAPGSRKILLHASIVLLFVWGTIAAFRPVRNADVWMNLRVAEDIIANGEIPDVDQYSAVAADRPLIVHEWLSSFIFYGIYKIGGGRALSVFRAFMMLAMLLLLWFSLEKRARGFVLTIPILALAAYLILERVFVRPHIFTLLFLCIWVFALEHWRRDRRKRYLIMLIPLQVLWANLHGGYLIALVIGLMMTGTTTILALRPSWSADERYSWSDAATFAVLTLACLFASFINPHGLKLMKFSLTVGFASDYFKEFVYEWGSPLAGKYMQRAYGFDAALTVFILMWLGLILNVKRRPLLDAVTALLATVLTVQAIRFIALIGILGFAVTVRAWLTVADKWIRFPSVQRRPMPEMALGVFILASILIYGFPYDKSTHRRIGWGFGGRLPFETVEFLTKQNMEGNIFNDYADGAFLIHHLAPKIRPVMDPRIDIYGIELTQEYFSSRDDPIKFFHYLNKYDVSLVLLMQTKKNIPVINLLSQIPASNLLLRADERFLFSYDSDRLPAEIRQRLEP
jgi:hypothetical protein